jgi:hypothetical protein
MNTSESSLVQYVQKSVLVVMTPFIFGISGHLAMPGTSSAEPHHFFGNNAILSGSSTGARSGEISFLEDSTFTETDAISTSRAISEVHRISGLTWEELGKLFHVSRRSIHFWASGQPMNSMNERFLLKVLDFFRKVDRGSARSNRTAIFHSINGLVPFDLISEKNFTDAEELLGRGTGRKELPLSRIDHTEKVLRSPLPPEQLVDAMNDRIHLSSGKGRAVRTSRTKRLEIE